MFCVLYFFLLFHFPGFFRLIVFFLILFVYLLFFFSFSSIIMHFILLRHHNVVHILLRIQTGLEAYVSIYLLCRCNMPAHSCADVQTPSNKHFYARQLYRQVLLRARISYGNSVCLSVCLSVRPSRPGAETTE